MLDSHYKSRWIRVPRICACGVLLLGATLVTFVSCTDERDWPEVATVAASVRCGTTAAQLERICQHYGAEKYGVPTEKKNTPQFYCYSGDTGISFWIGENGLERYQVWDSIDQPDGSSGRADPAVNVCAAKARESLGALRPTLPSTPSGVKSGGTDVAVNEPMLVGGEVTAPVVLKRAEPKWPEQVTKQRTWLYSLTVTKAAHVKDLQLIRGESGIYSRRAEDAIRKWELKPGAYRGEPVDVRYNLSVTIHVR